MFAAPQLEMNVMSDADQELVRRTEQMLEQERARLRKAKARQEAEIKSILEHETYLVGFTFGIPICIGGICRNLK